MMKLARPLVMSMLLTTWYATGLVGQSCVSDALAMSDSVEISRALESCLASAGRQSNPRDVMVAARALSLHHSDNAITQLSHWLEAERYLERMAADEERRLALRQIGDLYRREQFPAQALEYYQAAWLLLPNSQWSNEREVLLDQIGEMHQALGHVAEAKRAYQELLDYYISKGASGPEKQTLLQLASLYSSAGQPARARDYYFRLESLARNTNQQTELAIALNNIGYTYHRENELESAYQYFLQTYDLYKQLPRDEQLSLFHNLAICAFNRKDSERALEYIEQAQNELSPSPIEKARLEHLSAIILLYRKDYVNALRYLEMALVKGTPDRELMADLYQTGAEIYQARYELTQAIDYYQRHIRLKETISTEERLRKQQLDQQLTQLERTEKEVKLLIAREEMRSIAMRQLQADNERIRFESDKLALEAINKGNDIRLLRQQTELDSIRIQNELLAKQRTQSMLDLAKEQLRSALSDRNLADITQREALKRIELEEKERDAIRQIDLLNRDKAISNLELERQLNFRRYAYILGIALGLILLLIAGSWQLARRNNRLLARKNREIEIERGKAEALLLNILPDETAQELKETGQTAPRAYPEATVVFTDFSDFTALASSMTPEELLTELNECFIRFDEISEAHGLEKIKVIGDSYMCVGGLPAPLPQHAHAAVAAAIEMQDFIENRRQDYLRQGRPYWQMRVGIHSGPVVAGVVGKHKFSFDIWGDTVNTASRLEGAGVPGRINISTATYQLIKDSYDSEYRGELNVKGKGEIGMYFIAPVKDK